MLLKHLVFPLTSGHTHPKASWSLFACIPLHLVLKSRTCNSWMNLKNFGSCVILEVNSKIITLLILSLLVGYRDFWSKLLI
jgi:hypothetical protein